MINNNCIAPIFPGVNLVYLIVSGNVADCIDITVSRSKNRFVVTVEIFFLRTPAEASTPLFIHNHKVKRFSPVAQMRDSSIVSLADRPLV